MVGTDQLPHVVELIHVLFHRQLWDFVQVGIGPVAHQEVVHRCKANHSAGLDHRFDDPVADAPRVVVQRFHVAVTADNRAAGRYLDGIETRLLPGVSSHVERDIQVMDFFHQAVPRPRQAEIVLQTAPAKDIGHVVHRKHDAEPQLVVGAKGGFGRTELGILRVPQGVSTLPAEHHGQLSLPAGLFDSLDRGRDDQLVSVGVDEVVVVGKGLYASFGPMPAIDASRPELRQGAFHERYGVQSVHDGRRAVDRRRILLGAFAPVLSVRRGSFGKGRLSAPGRRAPCQGGSRGAKNRRLSHEISTVHHSSPLSSQASLTRWPNQPALEWIPALDDAHPGSGSVVEARHRPLEVTEQRRQSLSLQPFRSGH